MPNVRPLNPKKYGITKKRFRELYYWCLQYDDWKKELQYNTDTVGAMEITDMPTSHNTSDSTQQLALRRIALQKNCELLEQTAIEADSEIYQYIIKGVTDENATFNWLKMIQDIPCGKKMYYDRRRKFYWLLDKKKTQ